MSVMFRVCRPGLIAAALVLGASTLAAADENADSPVTKLPPVENAAKDSDAKDSDAKLNDTKDGTTAKTDAAAVKTAPADDAAAKKTAAPKRPARKVKQLSQDMTGRRDRVRRLLKTLREQPFSTQQNNSSDILDFCRGFGCDTQLLDNAGTGQKVNGITCLCWNMPCAGTEMMTYSDGHLTGRIGYGYQSQASELAAVLALADVPTEYPARCGRITRTVADIIEYEKATCRAGSDMSLKLVALSHYVHEASWKDRRGEEWTLPRMVAEELNRPASAGEHAATNRLLGLATALNRLKEDKVPLDGDLERAKSYVEESIAYAFSSQNSDGSWGRATNRDYATAVAATADMLQWLIADATDRGLEDYHVVQGIDFLTNAFSAQHYQSYISVMSAREISAAMHAAGVLNLYDQRVFAPADPLPESEPAKSDKPAPQAAEIPTQAR